MDSGFTEELESLSKTPDRAMDMSSAGSRTRERGGKLYGLLAGLYVEEPNKPSKHFQVVMDMKGGDSCFSFCVQLQRIEG